MQWIMKLIRKGGPLCKAHLNDWFGELLWWERFNKKFNHHFVALAKHVKFWANCIPHRIGIFRCTCVTSDSQVFPHYSSCVKCCMQDVLISSTGNISWDCQCTRTMICHIWTTCGHRVRKNYPFAAILVVTISLCQQMLFCALQTVCVCTSFCLDEEARALLWASLL